MKERQRTIDLTEKDVAEAIKSYVTSHYSHRLPSPCKLNVKFIVTAIDQRMDLHTLQGAEVTIGEAP